MIFNLLLILFISILYLLICSNSKTSNKKQVIFLRIMFFTFFVLVASREMTRGNDTQMYLNLFRNCASQKWQFLSLNEYFEKGYIVLNILISYISRNPRFFMIVMSGIINFSCYKFIKDNSKDYYLSVLLYLCFLFFYTSMSMMRQFTAFSILLISFKFIKEKKPLPFILMVFIASMFHSSAWLAILYYPMYNLKYTRKRAVLLVMIGLLISLNLNFVVDFVFNLIGRTNLYSQRLGLYNMANTIYAIMYSIFYLFVVYESRKINKKTNTTESKINSMYLYSLLFAAIINFIGINMDVISRAAFYFNFLTIIVLPNIIEENIKNKDNKRIIKIFSVMFLAFYSSVIIYYRPEWNSAFDYKTCIFPKDGYICNSE